MHLHCVDPVNFPIDLLDLLREPSPEVVLIVGLAYVPLDLHGHEIGTTRTNPEHRARESRNCPAERPRTHQRPVPTRETSL
jgi:hypothetical protein